MSAFKALRDVSVNFEAELKRVSTELFSAKISETFEECIAKKLRDLSLLTSKLRLLRAKPLSLTPQITEQEREEESTLSEYGETAVLRILEQLVVKSATQAHAVKTLVTAPDRTLDPEMVVRKEAIISSLAEYRTQEATVQHLDSMLREREDELARVRETWDAEVTALRDARGQARGPQTDISDPNYKKLTVMVEKLELMRCLMSRLAMPRSRGYDWLSDPHRLLRAIKLARDAHSVDGFLLGSQG
ncbi:uncharacterized protein LOC126379590 [Pectinophora gossypiella]|uniref:uncharacterized protein LOC126379590 n=1 Tax=Pectinophora gossypiella TaxID=13191 RepID=UPI00214E904A|nr:uncharacterized protein LOC126379590 [Pectinophora gossypiella]XP_049884357.1 uncharacterized protein LOC126379590 [Pectinophora gossypiella]